MKIAKAKQNQEDIKTILNNRKKRKKAKELQKQADAWNTGGDMEDGEEEDDDDDDLMDLKDPTINTMMDGNSKKFKKL